MLWIIRTRITLECLSTTVPIVSSYVLCLIIDHSTDIIADDLADNVPQNGGLLGAPNPHQGPPPSGNPEPTWFFAHPPLPQTLPQQTPLPFAENAVQPTAPPSTTAYPGYAPASQRIPGAGYAPPAPSSACAPPPHPGAQPPTPQEPRADTPPEPQPKKRGRGRPAGSRDKEKRDPKGTHAGKTKGELSKLARERAKKRREREAERAEEGEGLGLGLGLGQGQAQVPVPQSDLGWAGQDISVQQPTPGSTTGQMFAQQTLEDQNLGPDRYGWVDPMAGPSQPPQPPQQQQQFPLPSNYQFDFSDLDAWATNEP